MGCALSTGGSGAERGPTPAERTPKMGRAEKKLRRTGMSKTGNGENHIFKEKIFRKNRLCGVCSENIDSLGSFCKECKMAIHKKCELKVTAPCVLAPLSDTERQSTAPARHIQHVGSTRSLTSIKQRSTLPRSFSLDRVMDRVMERAFDFDLTYITERIISVFFPPLLEEQRYHANLQEVADMLKSKHQNNFLLFNLSEKRNDLTRISPKLHDFGWPDLHAPPLDRICAICKAMEGWLTSDPQHVVVLHCKGHKGKTGVIIAAYMHYSKISAGADQALSTLAMRKFCEDKLSTSLQPSQNRYIYYFGGLLSGAIKMNSSPLFLHQVLIPSLTSFHPEGGYFPFLKIYQSMQLVYTSGVYDLQGSGSRRLCVTIEPALLLKGDIMVKCYHRQAHITERETVFRLQFHTCTIHGAQLWFGKEELDEACSDDRFPSDATVEFVFSYGPEKIPGREYQRNHPAVTVDYNTADPVVRWDSYENFNLRHQDSLEDISHTRGPLDGSLYAQVKKRRGPGSGGLSPSNGDPSSVPSSPSPCPEDVLRPLPPTRQEREEFDCLLSGADSRKMRGRERERETAILDDSDAVPSERGRGMALGRRRSCRCSVGCEEPGCDGPVFLPNGCCPKTSNGHLVPPVLDLCQHHHPAMPPPELLWERQQAPSPCIQGSLSDRPSRRLCPCPAQELPLPPHAHTLPTPRLLYKGDGYTPILHHYAHMHHPHPSSPYREMMLLDVPAHPGCLCRDCRCRREESAAAVKAFHGLRLDQGEGSYYTREAEFLHREAELRRGRNVDLEWDREAELQREAGLRRGRDVAHHWDRHREAEMQWEREVESRHRRSTLAPYGPQHSPHGLDPSGFIFDPLPSGHPAYPEASHCHSYAYSHSHMDPKYNSASSGYQTPTPPYPCGPYHPSPSESRGYASGYQSESTSPLPNHGQSTASLGQAAEASDDPPSSGPHPQVRPSDCHTDGTGDVRDSMSWQEDVSQSSLKQDMRSTPSDVSDPPTPSHSSSTLPTQESPVEAEVVVRDADTVTVSVPQKGPQDLNNACPGPQQGHPASPDSHKPSLAPTIMLQRESPNQAHTSHTQVPTAVVSTKPIENPETSTLTQAPSESVLDPLPDPQTLSPGSGTALLVNASTSPKERSLESLDASPTPSSVPSSPHASSECPSSDAPVPDFPAGGRSLGAGHLQPYLDAHCSSRNPKTPSPVPDGQSTPTFPLSNYFLLNVPPVPYTGYTAVTIPAGPSQPPLPEKRHSSALCVPTVERGATLRSLSRHQGHSGPHHVTFLPSVRDSVPPVGPAEGSRRLDQEVEIRVSAKFVQDSSRFWYKPSISRDQAIAVLKDKEPGAFLIRDSSSFQGAYGLALKVATPPANSSAGGNPQDQLVRHFLIETGPRGVKIKGCQNEPYFGSLSALVYQHSITPISLPCALHIPDKDPVGELQEVQSGGNTSTAADLLRQGAACNVLYLDSVETESLTGPQAISKAINTMRSRSPRPSATVVHFKVSAQGITLTDNQRRVFFRRHYPINSVTYSSVDPQDRRVFGFVAKKPGSVSENVCHLFAETDPEQPATAIVNFINKVMLGPTRK